MTRSRLATAVLTATTAAATVAAVTLLPAGSQAVPVSQTYPVPADRTFTVHGHGFGHGHGMSQYGAQGAATRGVAHDDILAFYYPGTDAGQVKARVRVRITADTTPDLVVLVAPGLRVTDLGTGTRYPLPTDLGATRWRLAVTTGNHDVVQYDAGDGWQRWRPGGAATLTGQGQFTATGPLTLMSPAGTRAYRGSLRLAAPEPGSTDRDTVNVVGLEGYLKGVVPREMPASWKPEALAAQAVAARTYAMWSIAQNPDGAAQICDTTSCQVYGGYDDEVASSNAAVDATKGQIRTFDGEPAFTQFSSSSGGWTSAGSVPYLTAQADPYDDWSGNPVHDWTTTLSAARIQKAFPALGRLRAVKVVERDGNGQWKGRVLTVVLDGAKADRRISGDTFRSTFGLRSTWFSLG